MRFVRRASLVFSLVLIVAIAVGYVARSSELANDRDVSLSTASETGAARLAAIIDATTVASRAGADPAATADAVASVSRDIGVCVADSATYACRGEGPRPSAVVLDQEVARRASTVELTDREPDVSVYDSRLMIESVGADVTVFVAAPTAFMGVRTTHQVEATTLLPAGVPVGGFSDDRGLRQTSTVVDGTTGLYVVATGPAGVGLDAEELRFYLIIVSLAVLLMLLAGINLFVEQRSLVERASFDSLTKLPNRSEFERRGADLVAGADRAGGGLCLMLFDLNGFKAVNDTYGHATGDELLKIVGSRLRRAVRDGDIVARWGGDEFVVVMPGVSTEEMGSRRATQLAEQVSGRTRIDGVGEPLRVKVSVGVAIWPDHGGTLDDLVIAADQAMYEAKRERVTCRVAERASDDQGLARAHT